MKSQLKALVRVPFRGAVASFISASMLIVMPFAALTSSALSADATRPVVTPPVQQPTTTPPVAVPTVNVNPTATAAPTAIIHNSANAGATAISGSTSSSGATSTAGAATSTSNSHSGAASTVSGAATTAAGAVTNVMRTGDNSFLYLPDPALHPDVNIQAGSYVYKGRVYVFCPTESSEWHVTVYVLNAGASRTSDKMPADCGPLVESAQRLDAIAALVELFPYMNQQQRTSYVIPTADRLLELIGAKSTSNSSKASNASGNSSNGQAIGGSVGGAGVAPRSGSGAGSSNNGGQENSADSSIRILLERDVVPASN